MTLQFSNFFPQERKSDRVVGRNVSNRAFQSVEEIAAGRPLIPAQEQLTVDKVFPQERISGRLSVGGDFDEAFASVLCRSVSMCQCRVS